MTADGVERRRPRAVTKSPAAPGAPTRPLLRPRAVTKSPLRPLLRPRAVAVVGILRKVFPQAGCSLVHRNPWELLVSTILSAQCTDERVNLVTPALFRRYPDAASTARARPADIERFIRSTGFFRAKARSILGSAKALVERHAGKVPQGMEELVALRGVGRKTANVVRGTAFDRASGVVVDTHVARVSARLGLTSEKDPLKIERDLMNAVPRGRWILFSHLLILHGRRTCRAARPDCPGCPLTVLCPSADRAGRKP